MTLDELRALLPIWQERLGLSHWSIEMRLANEMENGDTTVFEIQRHENAHRAVISVPTWIEDDEPPADFTETVDDVFIEGALVHELCHLLFRDIVFVVRDDLEELLGQVAHELLMRQLVRHEEAAVDLLSRSLVEHWPQ